MWVVEQYYNEATKDIDDPFLLSFHTHILIDLGIQYTVQGNVFNFKGHTPTSYPKKERSYLTMPLNTSKRTAIREELLQMNNNK
jgi:hypothetical protein